MRVEQLAERLWRKRIEKRCKLLVRLRYVEAQRIDSDNKDVSIQSIRIRTVPHSALGALLASAIALAATTQVAAAASRRTRRGCRRARRCARPADDASATSPTCRASFTATTCKEPIRPLAESRAAPCSASRSAAVPTSRKASRYGRSPSGPAAAAGLKTGDVIVAIDGRALTKTGDRPRAASSWSRCAARSRARSQGGLPARSQEAVDDGDHRGCRAALARMLREHMPMLEGMQIPPEFQDMMTPVARLPRARTGAITPARPVLRHGQGTARGQGATPRKAPPAWRRGT